MHKNPVWLVLIAGIAIVTLWYAFDAATKAYAYMELSEEAQALDLRWSVRKVSGPKFIPHVKFHYEVDGKRYEGETTLVQYPSRSGWGAEDVIKDLDRSRRTVWYSPNQIEKAIFDKQFPTKECLYTVALAALLAYFLWIGNYVKRGCKI